MGLAQPISQFLPSAAARLAHQTHLFSKLTNTSLQGSLIVELSNVRHTEAIHHVIHAKPKTLTGQEFTLTLHPTTSQLSVSISEPNRGFELTLSSISFDKPTNFRITFTWSVYENTSVLTIENLETDQLYQAEINTALPLSSALLADILEATYDVEISPSVSFIGASGRVEPVGPSHAIAHGALIKTPTGMVPIQNLKLGDMVQTMDSGVQPIRWIGSRAYPTAGSYCPFQMRAPYHFLTQNIFVGPKQRILVKNPNVEYLFGYESALIEARELLDNVSIIRQTKSTGTCQLFHLLFDNHEIINAGGCNMESLFIGNISDHAKLLKTTVLGNANPDNLPRHTKKARPFLKQFEAKVLRSEMLF